jgi:hypothetical protein
MRTENDNSNAGHFVDGFCIVERSGFYLEQRNWVVIRKKQ